jgi:hypothetical protein
MNLIIITIIFILGNIFSRLDYYLNFVLNYFISIIRISSQVRWVPCHHGMARPQVADGGDFLQVWRLAANMLNKQSRTADKGWSSSLGVGRGANNSSP